MLTTNAAQDRDLAQLARNGYADGARQSLTVHRLNKSGHVLCAEKLARPIA